MKHKYLNISFIKKILPAIVIALLTFILFISPLSIIDSKATLIIDFGDHKRVFEGKTFDGMTVLDAMKVSSKAGDIKFSYKAQDEKIIISDLNGYSDNDLSDNLEISLNSSHINSWQINKIIVRPGDKIEIRTK